MAKVMGYHSHDYIALYKTPPRAGEIFSGWLLRVKQPCCEIPWERATWQGTAVTSRIKGFQPIARKKLMVSVLKP